VSTKNLQDSYKRPCAGAAKARAIRVVKREAGIPETRVERRVGILEARVARLEAKLTAAEREWAKNPKKHADLLAMETSETNIREEARYSTSEWGVKFRLMGDRLDDWRRRFLGSQREVALPNAKKE
jgi:hypothetical protein